MAKCPACGALGPETGVPCPNGDAYLVRDSALEVDAKGLDRYLGKLIGDRYAVVGYLGRGGMGVVYRARDLKGTGEVAVKVLINARPGKRAMRRFLREAKVAVRLRHPNIVATYGFGRVDEGFFLAMELIEGQPLSRYWRRGVPFDALVAIALQSLSALGAAHTAGVIHRDLKPGNILIGRNDRGGLMVKMVDFGLARFLQPERDELTRTGELVGTPRYMSPEQARGSRNIDVTTDLYALGVILYEFSTGKVLFDAEVPTAVALMHITEPVPPLIPRDGLIAPAGFEAVVRKLLAKDQKARYVDNIAAREALAPFLIDKSLKPTAEVALDGDAFDAAIEGPPMLGAPVASADPGSRIHFDPPVVGRKPQLARLWDLHRQAVDAGWGAVIAVAGETGVGKSRLLDLLRDAVVESGEIEWHHGETQQGASHGLGALRGALESIFGLRGHGPEDSHDIIAATMERWGGSDVAEVRRLADIFRLSAPVAEESIVGFADTKGTELDMADQELLFGSVERVFRRAASEKPVLIALEDLHWSGEPTRAFLEYLVPRLKTTPAPMVVIATFRGDAPEMDQWSEVIGRLRAYEPDPFHYMELERLDESNSRKLLRSMLKATNGLLDKVIALTSGNPLHIIQVLRFLEDSDMLREEGGVWDLAAGARVDDAVPPEMADLLLERLKRSFQGHAIEDDLTRIIERCAMVGRRVPYKLLVRILEVEGELTPRAGAMVDHLEEALEFYLENGVLMEDPDSEEDILEFCHGLLRETLFNRLKGRRATRNTHLAAARAKEQYYDRNGDAHADAIADHYEEARDWVNALDWHLRAGDVARRSWDLRACEQRYRHARALMEQLSRTDPDKQMRISEGLGDLCYIDGRYEEAEQHFSGAFNAAEAAGNGRAMAHLLFRKGNTAREQRDFRQADASFRECLAVSRALGDRSGIGSALLGLSLLNRHRNRLEDAHRFITAAEEQFEIMSDTRALADCSRQRAFVCMKQGDWATAKSHLQNALDLCSRFADKRGLGYVHRDLSRLAVLQGRNEEGQLHARKALDIFENIGARYGFAQTLAALGAVHRAQGHFQAAGDLFQRALDILDVLGADRESAEVLFNMACVAMRLGRPREATEWFDKSLERSRSAEYRLYEGLSVAGRAWAAAERDDTAGARTFLQQAHKRLPPEMNFSPDLAEIYEAAARAFDRSGEGPLASALRKKAGVIWSNLDRARRP